MRAFSRRAGVTDIFAMRSFRTSKRRAAASAPGVLLPAESRIAFIGDSRTNYGTSYVAGDRHYHNVQGWTGWMMPMLGGRVFLRPTASRGVVGDETDDVNGRFDADIAPHLPKLLTIQVGINDLKGTTRTFADMQTNMQSVIAKARALSSQPIMFIFNEPASSTVAGARETVRQQWNAWIASLAAPDIVPIDVASILNLADTVDSTDAVHWTSVANYKAAQLIAPEIISRVSPLTYPSDGGWLTNNVFASADGLKPTSWNIFDNGGGATIVTDMVTKDGKEWCEVTLSGTYSGTGRLVNIYQSGGSLPAGLVAGDWIESFTYLEVDSGAVGLNTVYFGAYAGAAKTRSPHSTSELPYPTGDNKSYLIRTPPIDYATGTGWQCIMSIMLLNAASPAPVNVKARFALPVFRKVSAELRA